MTVEPLAKNIKPYAEIPAEMLDKLRADRGLVRGETKEVCSLELGHFTSKITANWRGEERHVEYAGEFLCNGKPLVDPIHWFELGPLVSNFRLLDCNWLTKEMRAAGLVEPSQKNLQHFSCTVRVTHALIALLNDQGHKEVFSDEKLVEDLGIDMSRAPDQGQELTRKR